MSTDTLSARFIASYFYSRYTIRSIALTLRSVVIRVACVLALTCVALAFAPTAVHAQIYVDLDATGAGDGSSWTDAFTDLQSALDIATSNDEIWIAEGIYVPTARLDASNPRTATFMVTGNQDGLEIYGGFESGDANLTDRSPADHPVVLSGDLNSDDSDSSGDGIPDTGFSENAYRVVLFDGGTDIGADVTPNVTPATVLASVTITSGVGDDGGNSFVGFSENDSGGGLHCDGEGSGNACSPTLSGVTFTYNLAIFGGAIYNTGNFGGTSSPQITESTFTQNGVGIYNLANLVNFTGDGTSSPQITESTFTRNGTGIHNIAGGDGGSSPVITESTFTGNGTAILNEVYNDATSSPQITGSTFTDNTEDFGSAITSVVGSEVSLVITNCTFTDNFANEAGGAIYNEVFSGGTSSLQIIGSTFTGNSVDEPDDAFLSDDEAGGAIYNEVFSGGTSSLQIIGSTFTGNSADKGGAIYNTGSGDATSSLQVTNSTFASNSATVPTVSSYGDGGAIYNDGSNGGSSSPQITGSIFISNSVDGDGGAIYNDGSNGGSSSPQITGSTFISNTATNAGGAIFNDGSNDGSSSPRVTNTILWSNTAPTGTQVRNLGGGATATFSHTLVDGGPSGIANGGGASATYLDADGSPAASFIASTNLNDRPVFLDINAPEGPDGILGTVDDGLRLTDESPAINAGNNSVVTPGATDITGAARIQDGTVDLGAYEGGVPRPILHVDAGVTGGAGDGSSWTNAFPDLQSALAVAVSSSQIWIAEGVYVPTARLDASDPRTATFMVTGNQDGLEIYGGFESGDANLTDRSPADHPVVLSGDLNRDDGSDGNGDGIPDTGFSENAYHVVLFDGGGAIGADVTPNVTSVTVLAGVTITGGNAADDDNLVVNRFGGGLYCDGDGFENACSPRLSGVIFTGNTAVGGGAIYNGGNFGESSPTLSSVIFTGNTAGFGGAIYNVGLNGGESSPVITNSTFTGNSASDEGGAIYNDGSNGESSPQITEGTFTSNSASEGGAIFNFSRSLDEGGTSSPEIMGSTFTDNTADFGGAILSDALDGGESSLVITNSTFTGNSASDQGGAIYNRVLRDATSSPQITESTFTSNSASDGGAIFTAARFDGNSSPMITNSTFTGNTAAFGGAILSIANETSEVNLVLTGVTFNSNSSDTDGGAIYNASRESGTNSLQITGSTFTGNSASGGGAILNETKSNTDSAASSLQVTNTILWSNTAPTGTQVRSFGGGTTATFSHTLIDGGPSGIFNESGASATYLDADGSPAANFAASTNIDADPLFANVDNPAGADGILGTDDDGLRLQAGSPVVDRGTYAPFEAGGVAENVTTDLAGDARRFGLFPDFGAYEVSTITSTSNQITGATDLVGYVQPNGFGGLLLLRDAVDGDLAFSRIDERPESSDLPENVAPVTWEVSATVSPEPTYDLVFDVSSLPGIGAFDQLVLYKSADSGQTWGAVTSLGGALVLDEDRALVAVQDLVGFSQFTIASTDPSNPLPVELARFEAQRTGTESVTVQWQTLSETNNAGFEVQRAPVGSGDPEWNALTTVNGAGTTDTPQSYRFTDTNLPYAADSLSYRLRQIDTDGTESFSEAITVARQVTQAELLPTYPNPVRSQATVRFAVPEQQDVRIDLYDLLGRRVQTVVDTDAEGRTKAQIDVSGLASGTYFLRMQTDGYTETQRITVVR